MPAWQAQAILGVDGRWDSKALNDLGFMSKARACDHCPKTLVLNRVGAEKQKSSETDDQLYVKKAKQFADIVDRMTTMDPDRRTSANDGLSHAFLAEAGPGSKPAAKAEAKPAAAKK
eukprot:symbB.v1.2.004331.t3/scaffold188.1/size279614/20